MPRLSRSLLVVALAALPAAACQAVLGQQTEYDYLNGAVGSRYLHDYRKPDRLAALGDLSTFTRRDPVVFKALGHCAAEAQNLDAITNVDEDIFLVVQDEDGLGYTMAIHDGTVDLRQGLRAGVQPSLVVPLLRTEALELPALLADRGVDAHGKAITGLSADGLFEIVRIMLVPGLQALYDRAVLYPKGDRSALGLDDFVQFVLTPPAGSQRQPAHVTVVNVDGQWLFLQGWHGEPDVRIQLDSMQALDLYQAAIYAPRQAESDTDKELAARHFQELWAKAVSYTRSDH